jgi:hypothetical protein
MIAMICLTIFGVQYFPAVERDCDPELASAVDPVATLRAKEFEGREEQLRLGFSG